MKKNEIESLNEGELKIKINEMQKNLYDSKFNAKIEPPQNKMTFKNMRKDIARMLTKLNEIRRENKNERE